MRTRWRMKAAQDSPRVRTLAESLGVPPLIGQLLLNRRVESEDQARQFLDPKLTDMQDPVHLPGAVCAAERILAAVRARQPIIIYGDYDVDGVTASSILWHMLTAIGGRVSAYVPHRIEEGYGLNSEALAQLSRGEGGKPLIVSVDCGITAIGPAKSARDAGVDLIISDHHEFDPDALPEAYALVHPRLAKGCAFGELCGAGVAFKLAWQIARAHCGSDRLPAALRELLLDCMSFAALGTVADIVPLVGENRIITRYGLGQIKRTRFAGLNALIDAANLRDEKIDAYAVGFVLGPRLNACGRMGHARDAVQLFTSASSEEAMKIARFLTGENERRRSVERQIFVEARQMVIDQGFDQPDCRAIVLGKEGWHPGVVGIVASRLVEAFCRPVVMLCFDNGEAHGSARSVEGVSIHEMLAGCAEHLTSFGGHAMAAGLRLETADVELLRRHLVEQANRQLTIDDLTPLLEIDGACTLADVNVDLVRQMQRLSPFGRDNPEPLLCVRNVRLARAPQRVGSHGSHLKFTVTDGQSYVNAIAFGMGELASELATGVPLDVAFEPKLNQWQGRVTAQMQVADVRAAS